MNQDFIPHPVLVNYEAFRDVVIRYRRLKKSVGVVNNSGYLRFIVGKNKHYCHRVAYDCHNELIKDGLVIDQKNYIKTDNSLSNLQAVSQSQNTKIGQTGRHIKNAESVKSFDLENNEEKRMYFNQ